MIVPQIYTIWVLSLLEGINAYVFPAIEGVDAKDFGRDAEVIFATRIEGQLTPVTVKPSYDFSNVAQPAPGKMTATSR